MSLDAIPLHMVRRFPIEEGHIMMFARAIGDPNPIYRDREYAAATEFGGIIAPPTFVEAAMHFDDRFPFRPRLDEQWWGSAREPRGGRSPLGDSAGSSFHASTQFDYYAPLQPGMVLHAESRHGATWEKSGRRSGGLRFIETITEFRDESDQLVATRTLVAVATERKFEQATSAVTPMQSRRWMPGEFPAAYPVSSPTAVDLAPGVSFSELLVDDLSRGQICMYAGASGDFAPQHTDEVFNTRVEGYKTVFAHGMLTMGMTGRLITDWLGDGSLRRFTARFPLPVWPGDTLTAHATVSGVRTLADETVVDLEVATTNQSGENVLVGTATARIGCRETS